MPFRFLRFQIASWVRDPLIWPVLLEMGETVFGAELPNPTLTGTRWLEERIEDAFQYGRLLLVREGEEETSSGGEGDETKPGESPPAAPATTPPKEPKPPEKTWFRARLLDEDGDPMVGEDYVVVDTDGVKRQGKLDAQGEVYIPAILPPGKCTITFPNIHLNPLKRKK